MKKRVISGLSIIFVLTFVIISIYMIKINDAKKVTFEDEEMREVIARAAEVESADKLSVDDLKKVKEINIGYTGYYNTLTDIEKCRKLNMLIIGNPNYTFCHYYFVGKEIPALESKENIPKIETELGGILKSCSEIKNLYISSKELPVYFKE